MIDTTSIITITITIINTISDTANQYYYHLLGIVTCFKRSCTANHCPKERSPQAGDFYIITITIITTASMQAQCMPGGGRSSRAQLAAVCLLAKES